ncbi:MAG TPA: AzlC family ABC transporter permease [Gaiellaceae bacterium]|nr:AzlC family ABC transporter permease [Gaiellaceae bacterium]
MTGSPTPRSAGARQAAPIAVAVFAFGASFGLLAGAAGIGTLASLVMSATTFAGSAQFAAVSVLGGAGSVAAACTAAILLNARYLPIGISVAPAIEGGPLRRLVLAQLVVDESWAMSRRPGGGHDAGLLLGAGALLYACWVAGTAVGAFGGEALGEPETLGLDAAFPALFLALLVPQVRTRRALYAALLGGAVAFALILFASPGIPIVAASAACLVGWRKA